MEGDMHRLKRPSLECIRLGEENELQESIGLGRYFIGSAHYILNELEEAEPYLKAIVKDPYAVRSSYLVQGTFLLALIYIKQGSDLKANEIIESVISHTIETNDIVAQSTAKALQIELNLMQGKLDEALILDEHFIYELLPPVWFYYVPQLTKIKILLAKNTNESLDEAITLLIPFEEFLRKSNRKRILVDLLAIYALVLDAKGNEQAAFEKIIESLNLAAPGGAIRNYIDLGAEMENMINKLPVKHKNIDSDYIEKILNAFKSEESRKAQAGSTRSKKPSLSTRDSVLYDPITEREQEILTRLSEGLRNREIAEKLFLSQRTVKTHIYNIYQKLDVHTRIEAVTKARELGLSS